MRTLLANAAGPVRRVQVHGRQFLVAPVTMIVPGVLAGSNGPLYYPPDEVARDVQRWNGVPLTLGHPRSPDGHPISGRTPEVLNAYQLGNVYRTRWDGKALRAEAWFDEELVKRNGPDVHANLLQGKVTELSTGLFTDDEPVSNGKDPVSGKEYTHVARNYRPDHLAVLVGVKGACSVTDGCGVLVNAKYSFDSEKCPKCGAAMEGDPDTGKCNRCGKRHGKLTGKETVNAFCPTGEGGGVDPSCSPGSGDKGSVKSLKFKGVSNKPAAGMSASQINKELDSIDEHSSKITDEFISTGRGHETPREYLNPDKTDDLSARAQALHKRRQELTIERDLRTGGGMSRLPKGFGPRKLNYARRLLLNALNALLGSRSQPHSSDTGRFKSPGAGTGKSDTRDHALLGATELTDSDVTLGSAAAIYAATTGTPGAKPPWASDAAKWEKATAAALKSGEPATSSRYYALAVHVYRSLGGEVVTTNAPSPATNAKGLSSAKACEILHDGTVHGKPLTSRQRGMFGARCGNGKGKSKSKKAKRNQSSVTVNQSSEDTEMATKAENVKTLTANCECWKGRDKVLDAMDDKLVEALVKQNEDAEELNLVVNELREEFGAEEDAVALNAMPAFIKKKIKAKEADPDDDDDDDDDDDSDDDDGDKKYKKNQRGGMTVVNKESVLAVLNSLSQDELLSLPGMAGIRERDQAATRALDELKSHFVDRLTANTKESEKKARREHLMKLNYKELEDRVKDLPSAKSQPIPTAPTFYLGAGPTGNVGRDDDYKPKPMQMPTINWPEEKKLLDAGASNRAN